MKPFKLMVAAAALLLAGSAAAQSRNEAPLAGGYRDGMPAVNTPAPAASPDAGGQADAAAFARWNRTQGSPRMLMFWNRELIEDGASQYDTVQTDVRGVSVSGRSAAVGTSSTYADVFGADSVRTGSAASSASGASVRETRQFTERTTDSSYGFRNTNFSRGVESAIMNTLIGAGARVVDREAVIRQISATKTKDVRMDIQYLETLALGQGIQYLVEILPDDDASSPTGVTFTVKITHLPTSTVRVQFATTGDPPRGDAKYVAVNGRGFEKQEAAARRAPADIGRQVAYETMGKLR
jgi:hypothetical protein